jgi:peptide chain release factor subunit 1
VQVGRVDEATVRRLAAFEADNGPVVSLLLDLGPSEFATPPARAGAVRALLDEANRQIEGDEELTHEERSHGREALERIRTWFEGPDFSAEGAHGLAVFCAPGDGLFEAVKLPRPVDGEAIVGRKPFVEPLVDMTGGGWCVLLASREATRVLRGSEHRLDEVAAFGKDLPRGHHDQGGWSQARYERSLEEDVHDHLKATGDMLYRRFKRAPFDHLILGVRSELEPRVRERLHPALRNLVRGRIDVDVKLASPEEVLRLARPVIERQERHDQKEAFERLGERLGDGRAASGLEDVLEPLNERRVETLLIEDGLSAAGSMCPRCGWLGPEGVAECPADGTPTDHRDDMVDLVIERAFGQSATVLVPRETDELSARGGVAAILRF